MIAVDSGFLFALVNQGDHWHARARSFAATSAEGWVCTWPVLTEVCHLLLRDMHPRFVAGLMDDVAAGAMDVWSPPDAALGRIGVLMNKYADLPMDLADASLVLLAEHLGHGRILSTDRRDFGAYRWKNHEPFHNLLEDPT